MTLKASFAKAPSISCIFSNPYRHPRRLSHQGHTALVPCTSPKRRQKIIHLVLARRLSRVALDQCSPVPCSCRSRPALALVSPRLLFRFLLHVVFCSRHVLRASARLSSRLMLVLRALLPSSSTKHVLAAIPNTDHLRLADVFLHGPLH